MILLTLRAVCLFVLLSLSSLLTFAQMPATGTHMLHEPVAASPDPTAVFDATQPASFGQSPVTVLVLDQLNTHFADSAFARRSLLGYLARQPALLIQPTTLLTVYDNHLKTVQAYTRDRGALLRALAAEPTHKSWNLDTLGESEDGPITRLGQSLRALEQIARSSAPIPGRKNMIWIGGGFPTLDPTTIDGPELNKVQDTIQHLTRILINAHVTMYAVDPASSAAGMTEFTDPDVASFAAANQDSSTGSASTFNGGERFERLAQLTGGRVIRGMNDLSHQIALSNAAGKNSYAVGYSPSAGGNTDAKCHRIGVDCQRLDVSVQRHSRVGAAPDTFVVQVGVSGLTWKPSDQGSSTASVEVMAEMLDNNGNMFAHTLHGMTAHAHEGTNLQDTAKTADFAFKVDPAPKDGKPSMLRFVVRDQGTGRVGTFDIPSSNP
jgi:VWFA-related protein